MANKLTELGHRGRPGKTMTAFWLDAELRGKAVRMAKRDGVTLTVLFHRLLADGLSREDR